MKLERYLILPILSLPTIPVLRHESAYMLWWHQNIQQLTVQTDKSEERKGSIYISIEKVLKYTPLLL
jgi:hypothetical protein